MAPTFPNDENGQVLRGLFESGDPLTEPREINFHFTFPTRGEAIGFIEVLDYADIRLELSWYVEGECWQVTVVKFMLPDHKALTDLENRLIEISQPLGGKAEGWGCFSLEP
ncbi:MAG: ribonuclease E inhibitor RraB [Planctomycetaceae bacterium]|nr:ribonuclease E inhibitor RraB [Planctomycetaceae bacterium]